MKDKLTINERIERITPESQDKLLALAGKLLEIRGDKLGNYVTNESLEKLLRMINKIEFERIDAAVQLLKFIADNLPEGTEPQKDFSMMYKGVNKLLADLTLNRLEIMNEFKKLWPHIGLDEEEEVKAEKA